MRRSFNSRLLICFIVFVLFQGIHANSYLTDSGVYVPPNYTSFAPPAAGGSYVDPVFGTSIKRISDARSQGKQWIQAEYSTKSPFNSDNSRLLLVEFSSFGLYDADTAQRIKSLPIAANSEPLWSRTDPDVLYLHSGNRIVRYNVASDVQTTLRTFSEYGSINFGNGESELGHDGDHIVVAGDGRQIFVYTISTNNKGSVLDTSGNGWDAAYLSPDNNVLVAWSSNDSAPFGRRYRGEELFDSNMRFLRQIVDNDGHKVFTRDTDGREVLIQTAAASWNFPSGCDNGIVKYRLDIAFPNNQTCILGPMTWSVAVHVSAPAQTGWAFVETYNGSTSTSPWYTYTNELLQVKLDGTQTRRLVHHRSNTSNYDGQPRLSVSRDGTRLAFNSNMMSSYSDAYVATISGGSTSSPSILTTSLPAGMQSNSYSAALAGTGGTSPYTWSVASGNLPSGLGLATATGMISGTPAATGTSSFTVRMSDSSAQSTTRSLSITVNAQPTAPSITTTSLPAATQGSFYSTALSGSGGTAPYSWSLATGSLPSGIVLSLNGTLSGAPTTNGTASFTVRLTDANSQTATRALSLTVNAPPISIPRTTDPFMKLNLDETSGSTASDSSGNGNNATLLNSPVWQGATSCKVNGCLAFNGANQSGSANLNLSDTNVVTVSFWMYWNNYSNNDNLAMEMTPNFNNSTTGFMINPNGGYFNGGGQFEAGLRGNAGYNQVVFTRPSAGTWHHYAIIFNKGAAAASQVVPYVDGVPVAYSKPTSTQNSNNFGSDTLYLMSRAASRLFGAGRLDEVQIFKRELSAAEIAALAVSAPAVVVPPPTITSTTLAGGTQNVAYNASLAAIGGTLPYTWSVTAGSLPAGLSLSSGGVISGTPTGSGTSSFTVQVRDANGSTAFQALTLTIAAAVISSPITTPTTTTSTTIEQNNSAITYTQPWLPGWYSISNSRFSGGSAVEAMDARASATVSFTGTGISWIGYKDPWSGIAQVYLDGTLIGNFDTYSSQSVYQAVIYSVSGLPAGSHTLRIYVPGQRNSSSGGSWVWIDAFRITP